ncbi:TetR/AcrR family transcriptional regulator [Streptomyces sp. B1I3]|uniref:TetR/AcrR family transcriptional regulator n=1 Tax=Streptomyces sp. B1I3 TaxID=3042264 RepID=UPI00278A1A07|nr:TetR/AcrR family transcriptional regulator [Streptomyces sp. B1I3]MDQ0792992.1 AcrR family transcriptional regulator [Streptomyces sp. B1I3]
MTLPKNPPLGLRERKKRATRDALADTALRMAAERGLDQVTVEAVTAEVGVSVRTFFNYFGHLDDAILVADPDLTERTRRAIIEAPAGSTTLTVLREAISEELTHIEVGHDRWELQCTVLGNTPSLFPRFLAARGADEQALIAAVAERLGVEADADLRPRLLVHTTLAAVRSAVELWTATGRTRPLKAVYDEAFAELTAALRD